jgi:dolichol-phosphate mannosyltransferase
LDPSVSPDAPLISVLVPIYNEQHNVVPLVRRLEEIFQRMGLRWELVFALDPSPDGTQEEIVSLIEADYPIRLVLFSRRIGKPLSLLAGLDHCTGDACVVMDADLQDPPELIEQMVQKWRDGYKVVIAQRRSRKGERFLYLKAAELFYWLLDKISEVKVPRNTGDFRLLDARVVTEVRRFKERHGFFRGITAAVGFPTAVVPFDREARYSGKTQISWLGAVNIALDGIIPFSRAPVRLVLVSGVALLLLGLASGLIWLFAGLAKGFSAHWPIAGLAVLLVGLSGIIVTSLGILGEYLVRVYEEARERPLYIVQELKEARSLSLKLGEVTKNSG